MASGVGLWWAWALVLAAWVHVARGATSVALRQTGGDIEVAVSTSVSLDGATTLDLFVCFETARFPTLLNSSAFVPDPPTPFATLGMDVDACDVQWEWAWPTNAFVVRTRGLARFSERRWSARAPWKDTPRPAFRVYDGALGLPRASEIPAHVVVAINGSVTLAALQTLAFNPSRRWSEGLLDVVSSSDYSCGVQKNGKLRCWGNNAGGPLGLSHTRHVGDDEDPAVFGVVEALSTAVVSVSTGFYHSCAILLGGALRCWGYSLNGQTGVVGAEMIIGDNEFLTVANSEVNIGGPVVAVDGRQAHSCAILATGDLRCWGRNLFGCLGYGHTEDIGDDEAPATAGPVQLGGAAVVQVSTGLYITCAIVDPSLRSVRCWGYSAEGATGLGAASYLSFDPVIVNNIGDDELPTAVGPIFLGGYGALEIETGEGHACALLDAGPVQCWGRNTVGQLGLASPSTYPSISSLPWDLMWVNFGVDYPVSLSARGDSTCVVRFSGTMWCWGANLKRQQGREHIRAVGFNASVTAEKPIKLAQTPVSITAAKEHACAVLESGHLQCWGTSTIGRLGVGHLATSTTDQGFLGGSAFVGVTPVVEESSMELRGAGQVAAWSRVMARLNVTAVAAGAGITCIITNEGKLYCAGKNDKLGLGMDLGDLGMNIGDQEHPLFYDPVDLGGVATASIVTVGDHHTCVLLGPANAQVRCWGFNEYGQLGLGNVNTVGYTLRKLANGGVVTLPSTVTSLHAGGSHTCAVLSTGVLVCWGENSSGQLGLVHTNNIGDNEIPTTSNARTVLPVGVVPTRVSCGRAFTCILTATAHVRCWGSNTAGQLGLGLAVASYSDPSALSALAFSEAVRDLSTTRTSACAVLASNNLKCWGFNGNGELGYGSTLNIGEALGVASVPDVPLGGAGVVQVQMGYYHTCVILNDTARSVRCWGFNADGRLGLGNAVQIGDDEPVLNVSPVVLGGRALSLAAGETHTCAIMEGNQLRCWGRNGFGELFLGHARSIGDDEVPMTAAEQLPLVRLAYRGQANVMQPDVFSHPMSILSLQAQSSNLSILPDLSNLPVTIGLESVLSLPTRVTDPDACVGTMRYWGATRVCTYDVGMGWFEREPGAAVAAVHVAGPGGRMDTKGSTTIVLVGFLEWLAASGMPSVLVGPTVCARPRFLNLSALACDTTAGVGTNLPVTVFPVSSATSLPSVIHAPSNVSYQAPSAAFIIPDLDLSPAGTSHITVQGEFFGGAAFSPVVRIGGRVCVQDAVAQPASDTSIKCRAPAMYATSVTVTVEVGGQVSAAVPVSYRAPSVESIAPQRVLPAAPGVLNTTFRVTGRGFGGALAGIEAHASIGGVPCPSVAVLSDTALDCVNLPHPLVWTTTDVEVWFRESNVEVARATAADLLRPLALPQVARVSAAQQMPTQGGGVVVITGMGLGLGPADVVNVTIGQVPCSAWDWVSDLEVRGTAPAGVGAAAVVAVTLRSGLTSPPATIAYDRPVVSEVQPAYALSGTVGATLVLHGENFGWRAAQFDLVTLGGAACGSLVPRNHSVLECRDWSAPTLLADNDVVEVRVGDQSSGRVRGLFRVSRPPALSAASGAAFPTAGGTMVRLVGDGLGEQLADVREVRVGQAVIPTAGVTFISSLELQVRLPPGVGAELPVSVVSATNRVSTSTVTISYDRPVLLEVQPNYAVAGTRNASFLLFGANFGRLATDFDRVLLGGGVCARVTPLNESLVLCDGWDAPDVWRISEYDGVEVRVAGQSSGLVRGIFAVSRPPALSAASAVAYPTAGGTRLRIVGDGFGMQLSDLREVHVGDVVIPAEEVTFVSSLELQVTLPPGVGTLLPLAVDLATGASTRSLPDATVTISYEPPRIARVEPAHVLAGHVRVNLTVEGSNFGFQAQDFGRFLVGGVSCTRVRPVSATVVVCELVAFLPVLAWPSPNTIEVEVGGQSSGIVRGVVQTLGVPQVLRATPQELTPYSELIVLGDGFGASADDIEAVLVAGVPCEELVWTSAQILRCRVPSSHWLFGGSAPASNLSTVAVASHGFSVLVETRSWSAVDEWRRRRGGDGDDGILSVDIPDTPSELGLVGERLVIPAAWVPRSNPTLVVGDVSAVREVGRSETLRVTFSVPDLAALALGDPLGQITAFALQAMPADAVLPVLETTPDSEAFASDRTLVVSVPVEETVVPTASGSIVFRGDVVGLDGRPFLVRVQAQSSGLGGPWSEWVGPVFAACLDDEYLDTHAPVAERVCVACPTAAMCGGLQSENVTARQGFWRVPWSVNGIGFTPCLLEPACEGVVGTPVEWAQRQRNASGLGAVNDSTQALEVIASGEAAATDVSVVIDRTVAVQGLRLDPSTMEGCREGHVGVLCSTCAAGFYKDIAGLCQPCGSTGVVAGRIGALIIAVMIVLGIVLMRRLRRATALEQQAKERSKTTTARSTTPQGLSSGSINVRIWKIVFNHIQTIGIISAIRFGWPKSVQEAYDSMSLISSLGSEGVSLECALGKDSTSALGRTLLAMSVLLWLMAISAVFWGITVCVKWRRFYRCCTARAGIRTPRRESVAAGILRPDMSWFAYSKRHKWWDRMKMSIPVLVFLVHTAVTKAAFRLVTCRDIAPDDDPGNAQSRLAMELDIRCDDPETITWMLAIAMPVLVFFSLGVPLLAILILHSDRVDLEHPHTIRLIGFLYSGYRPGLQSWEAVNFIRKVFMAGVTVVLAPLGAMLQVSAALVVIVVAQAAQSYLQPFVDAPLNKLELHSLLAASFTMISGMMIEARRSEFVSMFVGPAIIFTVNLLFFADAIRVRLMMTATYNRFVQRRMSRRATAKSATMTSNPVFLQSAATKRSPDSGSDAAAAENPSEEAGRDRSGRIALGGSGSGSGGGGGGGVAAGGGGGSSALIANGDTFAVAHPLRLPRIASGTSETHLLGSAADAAATGASASSNARSSIVPRSRLSMVGAALATFAGSASSTRSSSTSSTSSSTVDRDGDGEPSRARSSLPTGPGTMGNPIRGPRATPVMGRKSIAARGLGTTAPGQAERKAFTGLLTRPTPAEPSTNV